MNHVASSCSFVAPQDPSLRWICLFHCQPIPSCFLPNDAISPSLFLHHCWICLVVLSHLKTLATGFLPPNPAIFFLVIGSQVHFLSNGAENVVSKKAEKVMLIAIGHEHEVIEVELEGSDILEINYPAGPFGSKKSPANVKSYYDRRIVGYPGDEGVQY